MIKRFLFGLILLVFMGMTVQSTAAAQQPQPLTSTDALDAQFACQVAIERVYWQNRTWPADSEEPKPAFETAVDPAGMRARVENSLRQVNALDELFQRPITGGMLQAEMERMATQTRQPQLLLELFAALDNDPAQIAECLARPVLADRLLRNWFSTDERFQEQEVPFAAWWAANRASFDLESAMPAYTYTLPEVAANAEAEAAASPAAPAGNNDTWVDTPTIPNSSTASAVWTGSEMLFWGGGNNASFGKENFGWRYNPATDTWATMSNVNAPEPRASHTAIWTGTEMIVWGGCNRFDISFCATNSGGRYNPLTDTWTPTSTTGAPSGTTQHSVIWTGTKMIVWGGCTDAEHCNDTNTGGAYDPATNSWTSTSLTNAPASRYGHTAVWTGTEMIVWGGYEGISVLNTGGRYNPNTNTWTATSLTGAPAARWNHTAVWAEGDEMAGEMIVWGGCDNGGCSIVQGNYFGNGARYNPANNSWTTISNVNAPSERIEHSAVWTGSEMIIWGGTRPFDIYANGGRYNRATDTWSAMNTTNTTARFNHRVVWTGSEMIVWGGTERSGERYDPAGDSWVVVNNSDPTSYRSDHTAVWTGTEMIAWGGSDTPFGTFYGSGVIYTPATASWRDTNLTGAPNGRYAHTAVWTGLEMVVWGGADGSNTFNTGGRYNPVTDSWLPTRTQGAPISRGYHTAVLARGRFMMVWGGSGNSLYMNTGSFYDTIGNRWKPLSTVGAPAGRYIHTAVWTGTEMIVWGGVGSGGYLSNGGRFNFAARAWFPMTNANAPSGRYYTTSVWTGTEMLVWGGRSGTVDNPTHYNTGGLYNPASNTWTAMTTTNAPQARSNHTAVWTGSEFITWGGWGGQSISTGELNNGGRYYLATDTWQATSDIGAPSARKKPTAVWTGTDMIIWGGEEDGYLNTGGHYFPAGVVFPDSN